MAPFEKACSAWRCPFSWRVVFIAVLAIDTVVFIQVSQGTTMDLGSVTGVQVCI